MLEFILLIHVAAYCSCYLPVRLEVFKYFDNQHCHNHVNWPISVLDTPYMNAALKVLVPSVQSQATFVVINNILSDFYSFSRFVIKIMGS